MPGCCPAGAACSLLWDTAWVGSLTSLYMGSLRKDGWYCSHNTVNTASLPLQQEPGITPSESCVLTDIHPEPRQTDLPVHSQQQKPDEIEQGLNEGRPILDGWMLLCVRCKDHQCTVLIFQTEKPAHENIKVNPTDAHERPIQYIKPRLV